MLSDEVAMTMRVLPRRCDASSDDHYWTLLQSSVPTHRYWLRWNLAYTKRVMAAAPGSATSTALLDLWSPRIRHALLSRFGQVS